MAPTVISPEELRSELKQGLRHPVYLLAGSDRFRAERTAQWLRQENVDPAMGDLNVDLLWADDTTPAEIAQKASAYAMFGGRRLVWVRHCELLPTGETIAPLLRYLDSPSPDTTVVFTSDRLDKRLKFVGACAAHGRVVDFAPLRGAALRHQVQRQAAAHGVSLQPEAVELLLDLVGEDLGELESEVQKLALARSEAREAQPWSAEEIHRAVSASRDLEAFELVDCMDPRDPVVALRQWFRMRQRGSDVYGASAIVLWRFRQLMQLRATLDDGVDARDAARKLGLSPWQAKRLTPLALKYSSDHLMRTLELYRRAEGYAKGTGIDAGMAYDLAFLGWASEGAA